MENFWQQFGQQTVGLLISVAVALLAYVGNKAASAALQWARLEADKHDESVLWDLAEAGIIFAEARFRQKTGAERMKYVLDYLDGRGVEIDEEQVEAIFQQLQKRGDLPTPKNVPTTPLEAA